jgi:Flp pilus assembly protein TadG
MLMFWTNLKSIPHAVLGTAAVEFAIAAPVLLILVFGVAEIGYSGYQAMQVQDAVEAGALYVSKNGWSSSGITNAILNATDVPITGPTPLAATPAPAQFCGCPGTTGVTAASCASTCSGGNSPGHYVQINATLTRKSLIPNSGLPLPTAFTAQSIVRLS